MQFGYERTYGQVSFEIKAGALNSGNMDFHVVLVYYYFFQNTLSSRLLYSLKKTKHASIMPLKKPEQNKQAKPSFR